MSKQNLLRNSTSAPLDWPAVLRDPRIPLVVTNNAEKARELCRAGQPAIAVVGVSEAALAALLRSRGANVVLKSGRH